MPTGPQHLCRRARTADRYSPHGRVIGHYACVAEQRTTAARSTYTLQVQRASKRAEDASGWANVADQLAGTISTMEWGVPQTTSWFFPFLPRDLVKIIDGSSGAAVASWRLRRDDANGLSSLIAQDLDRLDTQAFEKEWNLAPSPPAPTRPQRRLSLRRVIMPIAIGAVVTVAATLVGYPLLAVVPVVAIAVAVALGNALRRDVA
jgi:hypothetical protein